MFNFISKLLLLGHSFTRLEELLLHTVREALTPENRILLDKQVKTINKVQRLPGGIEVDFYRMKNGKPTFDEEIAFNFKKEHKLAEIVLILPNNGDELVASIWCINGLLFSIEYDKDCRHFEEASEVYRETNLIKQSKIYFNQRGQDS